MLRQCRASSGGNFTVILNPYLKSYLLANCLSEFSAPEAQWSMKVNFATDPNVRVEKSERKMYRFFAGSVRFQKTESADDTNHPRFRL